MFPVGRTEIRSMSGMTYSVLVRSAFSASDSGRVTAILREMADAVTETRKGRH